MESGVTAHIRAGCCVAPPTPHPPSADGVAAGVSLEDPDAPLPRLRCSFPFAAPENPPGVGGSEPQMPELWATAPGAGAGESSPFLGEKGG